MSVICNHFSALAMCALLGLGTLMAAPNLSHAAIATDKVRLFLTVASQQSASIEIELYGNESPLHVANFLDYLNDNEYDSSYIHRSNAGSAFFLQGGSFKTDFGSIIPRDPVPNEFDSANGLSNTPGTLSAARTAHPDSATSGWFINQTNNAAGFDPGPYTVFGQVTAGMDLVDGIPFLPYNSSLAPSSLQSAFSTAPTFNNWFIYIVRAVQTGLIDGDFNLDGVVDAADYTTWLDSRGSSYLSPTSSLRADGNGDGIVDEADLVIWQTNFGTASGAGSSPSTGSGQIPEPSTLIFAPLLFLTLASLRSRCRFAVG